MSRNLALAAALSLLLPWRAGAQQPSDPPPETSAAFGEESLATAGSLGWNDPQHRLFFNYQRYLRGIGLACETPKSWSALSKEAKLKKLDEDEGFLKKKLTEVISAPILSSEDENLLKAVWGQPLLKAVETAQTAAKNGQESRIEAAQKSVASLAQKLGGIRGNWQEIFDGARAKKDSEDSVLEKNSEDYLTVKKDQHFLDSLQSKQVQSVLATKDSYESFLHARAAKGLVSEEAIPGLVAMYQVLSLAKGDDKAQLQHILPTSVRLIQDGKKIVFNPAGGRDAYGLAHPGDYDAPESVEVTPAVIGADPVAVGQTLAHELQHIYDMYTGRYYTLDSELRGFKADLLYFQVLKKERPDKYAELKNSLNDSTRQLVQDTEDYTNDFMNPDPKQFRDAIAVRYNSRNQGVFQGRMSLRESVDPNIEDSADNDLAMFQARAEKTKAHVAELEKQQADVRVALSKTPTRELEHQLEAVSKDLNDARAAYGDFSRSATIKELRLQRMKSEVAWMDAKSQGKTPDPYDLSLPVDNNYAVPNP